MQYQTVCGPNAKNQPWRGHSDAFNVGADESGTTERLRNIKEPESPNRTFPAYLGTGRNHTSMWTRVLSYQLDIDFLLRYLGRQAGKMSAQG